MKIKTGLVFMAAVYFILMNAVMSFSQESTPQGETMPETQLEGEMQWVWGEVVNVDMQNKMFTVKHFNYDTEQEEQMGVSVNNETNFENIQSIGEIKPADVVSIDYVVSPDGKNVAKNISIEKSENTQGAQEEKMEGEQEVLPPDAEEDTEATQDY